MLVGLFALNSFLCATLLFWLQPMFARMVLPLLGGSASVWNTTLVFYQAALLAGYAYAHVSFQRLGIRRQPWLHLALLALPWLVLPVAVPSGWLPPPDRNPIPWLLALLALGVGLPCFVISTSSPVLQRWFSVTDHRFAHDPYLLYAASNAGSVLALLAYPFLIEPNLSLDQQSRWWSRGYAIAWILTITCALLAIRRQHPKVPQPHVRPETRTVAEPASTPSRPLAPIPITAEPGTEPARRCGSPLDPSRPSGIRRAFWLMLSAVPCSLMLATTTFATTDIASVPLLWVIPLSLYLTTFILVFSRVQLVPHRWLARALPIVACAMTIVLATRSTEPLGLILILSLVTFFLAAMVCHQQLALTRPHPRYLTEFYLCLSIGGLFGGVFNVLLAPLLFTQIAELPIALTLACLLGLLGANPDHYRTWKLSDLAIPAAIGTLTALLLLAAKYPAFGVDPKPDPTIRAALVGIPTILCFLCSRRPLRFGLALGAILFVGYTSDSGQGRIVYAERTFFGVHRVATDAEAKFYRLLHGNTFHGMQSRLPDRRHEPLAYYHRRSPIGQLFAATERFPHDRIALIGLGTGALAAYGRTNEHWRFYELDPAVARLARDSRFFTYLEDSEANIEIVLGDARLALRSAPDNHYGLMVLDAYSSDAIPVHLLTREAIQLYRDKIAPDGILAFHISNVHLDLAPLVANLAHDAGLHHLFQDDTFLSSQEIADGLFPSAWILMAESESAFGTLPNDLRWERLAPTPNVRVWTDRYASPIQLLHWRPSLSPRWPPKIHR
jgi:spermidine synthase